LQAFVERNQNRLKVLEHGRAILRFMNKEMYAHAFASTPPPTALVLSYLA